MTTKISKIRECRTIILRARENQNMVLEQDKPFLLELLKGHNNYSSKVGCGVASFYVKITAWNNYGFYLKRIDGSETDFSFLACINPPSRLTEVKMACRSAIFMDMEAIKRNGGIAHHETAFNSIFKEWIKTKDIEKLEINPTSDNCETTFFVDPTIAEDFRKFHNERAVVREVSEEEHKKIHAGDKNE